MGRVTDASSKKESDSIFRYYALVTEANAWFARRTRSKVTVKLSLRKNHVGWSCLNTYSDKFSCTTHLTYCRENACQRVIMPRKGETMHYKDRSTTYNEVTIAGDQSFKPAFVLYLDFVARRGNPKEAVTCTEAHVTD